MKIDFFRYIGNGNKWVVNSIINPVMHNAGKWLKNLTVLTSQDPHEKIKRKKRSFFYQKYWDAKASSPNFASIIK